MEEDLYYASDLPLPETPEPSSKPQPWGQTRMVGSERARVDAYERVSGTAVYPSDVLLANMLYGAVLRCPYPHARARSIDTRAARGMPGVHTVITGESSGAAIAWPYRRDVATKLFDEHCRFEGEAIAAVAAETPHQARDALRAIDVDWEQLPHVVDERAALSDAAPRVLASGNKASSDTYARGDVAAGFAEAHVIVEETFRTEAELHTPLEPHGCVASWDGKRLTLWESTQGVFGVQARVAQVLGLPLSRVRVICPYMGGGFGSKLQAGKYTIIAALLAARTGRPVKLFLSREETYLCCGNRPPSNVRLKIGAKQDGTLTAMEMEGSGTGGAYYGGVGFLDWLVRDLYTCPNVKTETTGILTHAGPGRPFRAPGHPQGSWALEQVMDRVAEKLDMDPIELRQKNVPEVSQGRDGQPPYTTTGLAECMRVGAKEFGWQAARERSPGAGHMKRGVGMGACLWYAGAGRPPATVILKMFRDGSINMNLGASDIGTGTKTVMAMVAAEELGVAPETIEIEHADTGTTQFATPSGGSKTVPTESPAVRDAAIELKRQLLAMGADQLDEERVRFTGDAIVATQDESRRVAIRDLRGLQRQGVVVGVGYRHKNPDGKVTCPFAAHFCEVEVNTKTGEIRIVRFLGVHDSGRVLNRLTFDNQVAGGVVMGIGFGLTEARVLDRGQTGKLLSKSWHDYKLPTALDVPPTIESLPVEMADDLANTTGAKGLGEPVTIPTAAAIANAVYAATGKRMVRAPITPAQWLAEEG
jgi:xanthine dehydrogenase YagR molybdenum-binding subunit